MSERRQTKQAGQGWQAEPIVHTRVQQDIQHLTISDKTDAVTELEERAKFGRSQILHQNQAHEEELQSTPLTRSLSAKGPTFKGRGNCRGWTCRALVKCNPGEAVFDGGSFGHAQFAARSGSQILAQQEEVAPETFGQKVRMDGKVGFKTDSAACASACDMPGRRHFVYKGNALPAPKGASAQIAVPPGTRVAEAGAHVKRQQRRGQPALGPAAGQVP